LVIRTIVLRGESVLIYAPRRFGLVTPMSGEPDDDGAVDYVCRTEVNSSSTQDSESDYAMDRFRADCPP
jgi:hypothetical protein